LRRRSRGGLVLERRTAKKKGFGGRCLTEETVTGGDHYQRFIYKKKEQKFRKANGAKTRTGEL